MFFFNWLARQVHLYSIKKDLNRIVCGVFYSRKLKTIPEETWIKISSISNPRHF